MIAKVFPGSVNGQMTVPSSKSHTIRGLIIATLAPGQSVIRNPLLSEDCKTAAVIVQQFGAGLTKEEGIWTVQGTGGNIKTPDDVVNVNNSGTTLYFMTSIAALLKDYTLFTGDASIRKRPVQPLLDALNKLGAVSSTSRSGNACAPFFIKGPVKGGEVEVPCKTSQYVSSVMIAAPMFEGDTRITTVKPLEIPYLDMTIKWLQECGIEIEYDKEKHEWFEIKGGQSYKPFDKTMPSDWSSVAFPVVAGLTEGSDMLIHNMDFADTQGDAAVIDHLIQMGADITKDVENGKLIISGKNRLQGIEMDLSNTPDAVPILCVVGCMAEGTTVLNNVAGARVKETDRVAVMAEQLARMGADITADENTITIKGGKKLKGCQVNSYEDHRVAMALTVAALSAEGSTEILDAECASVTFPGFYEKLKNCGAQIIQE